MKKFNQKDEDEETQERKLKQRNSNQIEVNLNIANKLENIWINVMIMIIEIFKQITLIYFTRLKL